MNELISSLIVGFLCIGIAVLAVAVTLFVLLKNHRRGNEKTDIDPDWASIKGRITAARVEQTVRSRPDDDTFFFPLIEFEYTAGGRVYPVRQAVGRPTNLEFIAKRALADYPPGAEIVVYYDPENPGEHRIRIK